MDRLRYDTQPTCGQVCLGFESPHGGFPESVIVTRIINPKQKVLDDLREIAEKISTPLDEPNPEHRSVETNRLRYLKELMDEGYRPFVRYDEGNQIGMAEEALRKSRAACRDAYLVLCEILGDQDDQFKY